MKELVTAFLLLSGAGFFAIAAIGLYRLPDVFTRMHAVSKASSLGMGLVLAGVTLHFTSWPIALKSVLTLLFIFLTTPVAAHILARAAYRSGASITQDTTGVDEIKDLRSEEAEHELKPDGPTPG